MLVVLAYIANTHILLPTLSVLPSPSPLAPATMTFPPIDPADFRVPGQSPVLFRKPSNLLTGDAMTQPASDPSVVMDPDNSVAIDTVRALLSADFVDNCPAWIHLVASLLSDAQCGVHSSMSSASLRRFNDLSPSEAASLKHLQLALDSLDIFFSDLKDDQEDWTVCMGCVKSFQLPCSEDDWVANLTSCSGSVVEARKSIIQSAVTETHALVEAWIAGQRVMAQDAAVTSLVSDHAPDISNLCSDVRVAEWSRRILEAMKHHFMELHVSEASASLPQSLVDRLDAERQAKYNSAEEDACADAKHLYHSHLQNLQSAALEEAKHDFESWKSTTLIPEWQAAEAAAKAEKLAELDAFKHQLAIETEDLKENARIVAAKSLVHTRSDRESRKKDCRPKPVGVSRSVSRARSPSPTPSQKRDKTPTKADYPSVSQSVLPCAPGSDHARGRARPSVAQEVSVSQEILAHVEPLVGAGVAKAPAEPLAPSCSTSVATLPAAALPVLQIPASSDQMVALAAPLGDTRPSPAEPTVASGTGTIGTPTPDTRLVDRFGRYQSAAPSNASPAPKSADDRMMRLLGASISSALAPVRSSIEDISSRLRLVEGKQSWAEMVEEDTSMDNPDSWGAPGDGPDPYVQTSRSDPVVVKSEMVDDDSYDEVACRDAYEASYEASFGVGTTEFHQTVEGAPISNHEVEHPWFEELTCQAFGISPLVLDLEGHHVTFRRDLVDMWFDFCDRANLHGDDRLVPPAASHHNVFVDLVNHRVQTDRAIAALRGSTTPHPRDSPALLTRVSAAPSHGRAASDPISISSDGSKISGFTETSVAPPPRHVAGVLDLDTLPPGDGHGWTVAGGKKGRSFAQIAAASTRRPANAATAPLPPSTAQAAHGFLTKPQLDSLTKDQVIAAYNARFTPRLNSRCTSKDQAVAAFLERASHPTPSLPPPPRPVHKTEFTLVYDTRAGDLSGPSGRRGDAASYVRTIQQHVRNAGTKQAEVIGGRWTSQTSHNFVLTFNGAPSLDEVLRLRSIFARVFGPHYSIVPAKGYTRIVLNSIPTLRETVDAPLPSAAALRAELSKNAGLKDLIIFGDPFWLTARHPNARHGSISLAFFDPDGARLKDIMCNPPFLFGNRTTKPRKYESRPLISQCDRCWMLGHESQHCPRPKDTVICPICAGQHAKSEHHKKCQAVSKHTEVFCTCPVTCINCRRARKLAQGHSALSASCPLRAKFRSPLVRTGDSSDEEKKGVNVAAARAPASPSPDIVMLSDGDHPAVPPVVAPASSL